MKPLHISAVVRMPWAQKHHGNFGPDLNPSLRIVLDLQFVPAGGTGRPRAYNVDQLLGLIPDEGALRCEILRAAKASGISRSTTLRLLKEAQLNGCVVRAAGTYFVGSKRAA